jgi:hypothetical protein
MRTVFKWHRRSFLESVEERNKEVCKINLVGIVDPGIYSEEPICFISRTSPDQIYFVNNYYAACIAIKELAKNNIIRAQEDELTKTHMVPTKMVYTEQQDKELYLQIIRNPSIPTDCKNLIRRNILNAETHSIITCSKLDPNQILFNRKPDGMVKSFVKIKGEIEKKYVPGYLEKGFEMYHMDSQECSKRLCNRLHDYYYKVSIQVQKEVSKVINDSSAIRKDPEGIIRRNEQKALFAMNVLKGLVSQITGGGEGEIEFLRDDVKVCLSNEDANNLFMKAVLNGYSSIHARSDPWIVNNVILSHMCIGYLDKLHRGLSTCLPMSGIGYGFLNSCKKYCMDDIPDEYKTSLPIKNVENLVNVFFEHNMDIYSSPFDVITTVNAYATLYPLAPYTPARLNDINFMKDLRDMNISSPKVCFLYF